MQRILSPTELRMEDLTRVKSWRTGVNHKGWFRKQQEHTICKGAQAWGGQEVCGGSLMQQGRVLQMSCTTSHAVRKIWAERREELEGLYGSYVILCVCKRKMTSQRTAGRADPMMGKPLWWWDHLRLNESYNNHGTREKAENSELFTESEYEFKIMNTRHHIIYWLRLWTQGSGLDSTPTPPLCNLGKVI